MVTKLKRAAVCLILMLFMMLTPAPASSWTEVPYRTYIGTTGKSVTITWDQNPDFTTEYHTEARVLNPERDNLIITLHRDIPHDVNELTFSCPKTGHWVPQVRACINYDITTASGEDHCSAWATSITEPDPWWLFVWIDDPGEITY